MRTSHRNLTPEQKRRLRNNPLKLALINDEGRFYWIPEEVKRDILPASEEGEEWLVLAQVGLNGVLIFKGLRKR